MLEIVIVILTLIYFSSCITVLSYEDYEQVKGCCTFKGPGSEEYILKDNFNDKLMKEYNSTQGNWTGFTPYAIEIAKIWNADPYDALLRAFEKKLICADNKEFIQKLGMNMFYSRLFPLCSVYMSQLQGFSIVYDNSLTWLSWTLMNTYEIKSSLLVLFTTNCLL